MNEIPQDILEARGLLEEAESLAGSQSLFCKKYIEGLETLLEYWTNEKAPKIRSYIENVIISHGITLFKRLPTLDLEDISVWLDYTAIIVKHEKYFLDKIYEADSQLRQNVQSLINEWIDELQRLHEMHKGK